MTKNIRIAMTNAKCEKFTGFVSKGDIALPTVTVDLEVLSPAARFVAENVTSTRIVDEYIDHIDVKAISGMSMAERDRKNGKSEDYIIKMTSAFDDAYTNPMEQIVSFPIFGNRYNAVEDVFQDVVRELKHNGAVKLVSKTGKSIDL